MMMIYVPATAAHADKKANEFRKTEFVAAVFSKEHENPTGLDTCFQTTHHTVKSMQALADNDCRLKRTPSGDVSLTTGFRSEKVPRIHDASFSQGFRITFQNHLLNPVL